ncbi:MAG: hypothetical protein O3B74_12505 [Proteobacteria bacterium]|nr:hypothetical protein [Pseudomonadota bacterium]
MQVAKPDDVNMRIEPRRNFTRPLAAFMTAAILCLPAALANAESDSRSFAARAVRIVDFIGTLDVAVGDRPDVALDITGSPEMIGDVGVRLDGDTLVIDGNGMIGHDGQPFDATAYPTVRLRVPVATAFTIQDMDGRARIGDIAAPLSVRSASLDLIAGNVTAATIDRSGSGRVELGDVSGAVTARLGGSGDFIVGTAAEADIEKGGSGYVRFGRVAGGLSYTSFGTGDADFAAVDGPVVVETTSSGGVHIYDGRADPLKVVMREYGDFAMDGEAVNPDLTAEGASVVRLNSYKGELVARGTGYFNVKRR